MQWSRRPSLRPARLRVGGKFSLSVGVLVVALLVVAGTGWSGLAQSARQLDQLYSDNVRTLAAAFELSDVLHEGEATALQLAVPLPPAVQGRLDGELDDQLAEASGLVHDLRPLTADDGGSSAVLDDLDADLVRLAQLRRSGALTASPLATPTSDRVAQLVLDHFQPMTHAADDLHREEQEEAAAWQAQARDDQSRTRVLLGSSVGLSLLTGVLIVLLLRNDVVPRIRRYADFATTIADGRPAQPLDVRGSDELADLGIALNAMVGERATLETQEREQMEFVDTLQMTSSEDEAHELIKRHAERSMPATRVTVLQSSNSANRLLAATALPPDSDLPARLLGAEPRSCLAVRFARTHEERPGLPALLDCGVCGGRDRPSTCEPLLVGGAVIGSVLVEDVGTGGSTAGLAPDHRIRTTVAQAAPVLANLRNLAVAEFRANNDSLTGLPNRRATDDTLKRLVAQANRTFSPLSALMLDLDHFKQINDRFGHSCGDEVLAAVGAAVTASLRESDFAGRFGGEEFLVLLPDTDPTGALLVAEKVRAAVAGIRVPGVEQDITASAGIADLLAHGGTAASMLREADRALYAAKAEGRDRTVVAGLGLTGALPTG